MIWRRVLALGVAALLGALIAPSAAMAVSRGVYKGGSKKAARHMDISLKVLRGARKANWRIDVYGPCNEGDTLSRSVGPDVGNDPPDPYLHLKDGAFSLRWHNTSPYSGLHYSYVLIGHAVSGGFVGTFHYWEHEGAYRCNSHELHWRAHRTDTTFP